MTVGIRVTREEELQGLDIGEHGNIAYPDFAPATATAFNTEIDDYADATEEQLAASPVPAAPVAQAVPVTYDKVPGAVITKVTIIANQTRFADLQDALEKIGITGMTITNVFGHGLQKGHSATFRGAPVETRLLPKIKIDVVISKISTEDLIHTVRKVLYTGNVGDGKIFLYDVRDVIKIRTNERGYEALQD